MLLLRLEQMSWFFVFEGPAVSPLCRKPVWAHAAGCERSGHRFSLQPNPGEEVLHMVFLYPHCWELGCSSSGERRAGMLPGLRGRLNPSTDFLGLMGLPEMWDLGALACTRAREGKLLLEGLICTLSPIKSVRRRSAGAGNAGMGPATSGSPSSQRGQGRVGAVSVRFFPEFCFRGLFFRH